ncbi:hypothetical protein [Luteolibacter luteus]|uniref:Beta-barrel porin 2 n=1 Tax=Luteolibacter luteus TaxID=2728835 RepID=A0A858RIK9_9BACT|nr:hypothetical protein [Luteolibacter luteus]QJE97056.1 hypothetical protein HHL09_15095 [Luteolibacter luteus]
MVTPIMHSRKELSPVVVLASALLCSQGFAQDFALRLADGNQALFEPFPIPDAVAVPIKGGFDFGVYASATYDSNFYLDDDYTESEFYGAVSPWISYRSDPEGHARYSFEAKYSPTFLAYWNNSDLNGINQSGSVAFKYQGSRTTLTVFADYSEVSSADRLSGTFVEGSIFSYGIKGTYQIAPRTSLQAAWTASSSDYDSGGRSGADVYTTQLAGLWDATERIQIGPALRYTITESDNTGERDAIAALLKVRYQWGERFFFDASAGVEFAKNSRQGDDYEIGPAGSLEVQYLINERWTLKGSIGYATVPSPVNANYVVDDFSLFTALVRHFDRGGSLEAGIGISFSDYEAVGTVATLREDDQFFHAYLTYRRKLFLDRVSWESSLRYAANDGQKDWSQWQLTTGVGIEF